METVDAATSLAGVWLLAAVAVALGRSMYEQAPAGGVGLIVAGTLFALVATAWIARELR